MRGRNRQPACVERQVFPLGYGHLGPIGLDGRRRTQIRLRDAAIVRTRIRRRSAIERQRSRCFALKSHVLAAIGHAEPLVAQLVRRRGPARDLLVGKDFLGGIGRNRKRCRFALMHAGALRLGLHHGLARASERERQPLRRIDIVQGDAVASTLVIGDVQLNGIRDRAVAHVGHGRPLQVAPVIRRRRERGAAALGHGSAGRINRAVDRRRFHLKFRRLRESRRHRHVVFRRERPSRIRAHRPGTRGAVLPDCIPAIENVAFIRHSAQRARGAVLHLVDQGASPLIVFRRAIDMPAVARVDRHDVPRIPYVIRRVGLVRHRRPHDDRAEAHRRAAFIDPVAEPPTGERDGHHPRRRQVAVAGEGNHRGEARASRIRVHLQVETSVVEHGRQLHVLLGDAHVHGVVAQDGARIVDPMREAVGRPRDGHGNEHVALVAGLRSAGQAVSTGQKCLSAQYGALGRGDGHLSVRLELRVVHHVGLGLEAEHLVRANHGMPLPVGGPPDEPVAQARDGVERDGLPRLVGAGALNAATAVRGLALHHRGRLDRHLVRVGELGLKLQHAIVQGLDQVLVEHEPRIRVVGEVRLRAVGAHQLPADEASIVGLPRLNVHHLAELVHALARQLAHALDVRAERHAVGIARETCGVRGIACHSHRAIGKAADLRTLGIAPAIEGEAGLGRGRQRGALPLVEAAEAAHVARLRRGGDGGHRERPHAEHGLQVDIRAYREAIRDVG